MLVLSRQVGEVIIVQVPGVDPITICVSDIDRSRVRLAFDAPRSVLIYRKELLDPKTGKLPIETRWGDV
jgi:carbon storage regulator CsrA